MYSHAKTLLMCYLGFFPCFIFSQEMEIYGVVTTIENETLAGVTIYVKETKQGTLTDLEGNYSIRASKGSVLVFSYMGMAIEEKEIKDQTNLNITLKEDPKSLDEVVVTFKAPLVEAENGKLTFKLKNSALTTGLTAIDMLKKLPGVSVGQNDIILFRGASGINVMVNGRMTYLSGSQLVNFLKGMSAEDINKIELITAPTAEFDAAGNSGIINIIPTTNLKKGYAVDLRASISKGKYWMTNENLRASLRTKKINLYGSFDYNTPHSFNQNKSGNTIIENDSTFRLNRKNESTYKIKYYTWRLGAEWQFLPKHNIAISYHGYLDDFKSSNHSTVNKLDNSDQLQSYIVSKNNIIEPYHYDAVNIRHEFDIDSLGKKIISDANYTSYLNYSDGLLTTDNYDANQNKMNTELLRSHQPGSVKIISAQADADLPFETHTIKTGVKYAQVENDNQFRFDSLQSGEYKQIEALSNHFKYKEHIAAAYLSGSKKISKTTIDAGLRLEYTRAEGYTVKQDNANKWQYTKLFPSLSVGQIINDDNKIDVSLSRRINRPTYSDLNPVRWYSDKYYYYSGNPDLVPELSWIYSLTYSLKNKYIFSVDYNQSSNFINRRLSIDDNGTTIKSQSANFGKRKRIDFTVSTPFKLASFWDVLLFSNLSYTTYPISELSTEKQLSKWAASLMLQQDISLPKDYKINLSAHWFSSELLGIYSSQPTGYVDFGIKKSFFNTKLVAQLTVSDIFDTNRYQAYSLSEVIDYRYDNKPDSRRFGLTLIYHLGGHLVKEKSAKTDEQKRL